MSGRVRRPRGRGRSCPFGAGRGEGRCASSGRRRGRAFAGGTAAILVRLGRFRKSPADFCQFPAGRLRILGAPPTSGPLTAPVSRDRRPLTSGSATVPRDRRAGPGASRTCAGCAWPRRAGGPRRGNNGGLVRAGRSVSERGPRRGDVHWRDRARARWTRWYGTPSRKMGAARVRVVSPGTTSSQNKTPRSTPSPPQMPNATAAPL